MSTAALALQVAVRAKLLGDVDLAHAVTGVVDQVPEPKPYPFVQIGDAVETPEDTHTDRGLRVALTLHIWTRYRGHAQGLAILGHVDRVLDRQALLVPGWTNVSIAHEWHQTMRDPDPEIRHIPVRYRVWLTRED